MSDIRDLFQEVILDHYRKPRNFGKLEPCSHRADGVNALCGDQIHVYLDVDGDMIRDARFEGAGCAISTASASMMTQILKGMRIADAEELFRRFHAVATGEAGEPREDELGKLAVFGGVAKYPARVKCATLPWHTLQAALHGQQTPVSTE